jgi:hypothetical protein
MACLHRIRVGLDELPLENGLKVLHLIRWYGTRKKHQSSEPVLSLHVIRPDTSRFLVPRDCISERRRPLTNFENDRVNIYIMILCDVADIKINYKKNRSFKRIL